MTYKAQDDMAATHAFDEMVAMYFIDETHDASASFFHERSNTRMIQMEAS